MDQQKLIWIIEDDTGALFVYKQMLCNDYRIVFFNSVASFVEQLESPDHEKPNLIIADLGLPDGSYLHFLQKHKDFVSLNAPIMIVSAIDSVDVLRSCFKFGASEYLTKPFNQTELFVKIEALINRGANNSDKTTPELRVDYNTSCVYSREGKRSLELTKRELQIMNVFLSTNSGVSRNEFMNKVWGKTTVTSKVFDVHLTHLRAKLAPLNIFIYYKAGEYHLSTQAQEQPQAAI
jgi:DNA-binding response OmpR family regulator